MKGHEVVILALAVVAAASVLVWIVGRRADNLRVKRFSERPSLSAKSFWEQFYRDQGVPSDVVTRALLLIEGATGIPGGKVRPGDRFAEELAPQDGWEFDDSLADLRWYLEAASQGSQSVHTVDDFIRALEGLEDQRQSEDDGSTRH